MQLKHLPKWLLKLTLRTRCKVQWEFRKWQSSLLNCKSHCFFCEEKLHFQVICTWRLETFGLSITFLIPCRTRRSLLPEDWLVTFFSPCLVFVKGISLSVNIFKIHASFNSRTGKRWIYEKWVYNAQMRLLLHAYLWEYIYCLNVLQIFFKQYLFNLIKRNII